MFGIHGSLLQYTYFYTLAHSLPDFKDDCSEFMVRYCSTRISSLWHTPYQISKMTVRNSWFATAVHVFLHFGTLLTRFQRRLFGIHGSQLQYTYFYTLAQSLPALSRSKESVLSITTINL